MSHTSVFRRGLSALVALVLMVGLAFGQNNLNLNGGTVTNSGTIRVKGNIDNSGTTGYVVTTIGGTVELKGTSAQSIGTDTKGAINFTTLSTTGASIKTFNVKSTIATSIDHTVDATYVVAASDTLILSGTIANTGLATTPYTFNNSGSLVNYAGGAQTVFGTTYASLTTSAAGNKTMNGNTTVNTALTLTSGNLDINDFLLTIGGSITTTSGTLEGSTSSDISFTGTGSATLPTVTGGLELLTINRTGLTDVVTLGGNLSLAGALTLTDGELAVNTTYLTLNAGVSASSGTLTSATSGTVDYAQGSAGQTVLAANYGNLIFSNFNKTLPEATVGIATAFTPGSATAHTVTNNTIAFNGTTQDIPSFNGSNGYNTLVTEGDLSVKTATGNIKAATLNNGTAADDSVTFDLGSNTLTASTIVNDSSLIKFGGTGLLVASGSVEYSSTSAQTIVNGTYYNLLVSGNTSTKTVTGGAVGTMNHLSVPSGTTLDIAASGTLNLKLAASLTVDGTLTNAGIIDIGN